MDGELKGILWTGGIVVALIGIVQCFVPGGMGALFGILTK